MTRDGVEGTAKFPATSVPHWESYGWRVVDPPARPPRPSAVLPDKPAKKPPAEKPVEQPAEKPAETGTNPKTPKPSARNKED